MTIRNFLRGACTAAYRISVIALLAMIAIELSTANNYLLAIGQLIFKVVGGATS